MTAMEEAAWEASVLPILATMDAVESPIAVVSVKGDESVRQTSTGVGTEGRASTQAIDSDGGATSGTESNSSRLLSVESSSDIVGGGPRAGASSLRGQASPGIRGLISKEEFEHQLFGDKASLYNQQGLSDVQLRVYPNGSIKRPRPQVRSAV
jgi:hypothetical protein